MAAPPASVSQVDAIANLQDIFESWCLHAPLAFLPMRSPLPARPSVAPHEPPRVSSSLPLTLGLLWLLVPAWSPLPMPAASTLSSPAPVPPCFQATPQWLNFSDVPSPRVVSQPWVPSQRVVIEPWHLVSLPPPVLPTCKPISNCTCSRGPAPLALFTAGQPLHECVTYHVPTTKSIWAPAEPIGFSGLCKAMQPAEIDRFAYLCQALMHVSGPKPCWCLTPPLANSSKLPAPL